jgi:hypothetical protein
MMNCGKRDLPELVGIRRSIVRLSNGGKNLDTLGRCVSTCTLIKMSKSSTYTMSLAFEGKNLVHIQACSELHQMLGKKESCMQKQMQMLILLSRL